MTDRPRPARRHRTPPPPRGKREQPVRKVATELALAIGSALISAGHEWTLLGPSPCLLGKLRGYFRWHILIKAPVNADISNVLSPLLAKRRKSAEDVRVAVDVDPFDLF